ncbi:MAG TPA: cyclase family protein [Candidatus Nitrosotalea sp.]|nr:cyclase family protein [Candidatus Nitrosotalea sp.]
MDVVDLTLEISEKLPSFPGSPKPQFITWADKKSDGYNLEMLFLSSHTGTHIDAPYHFIQKGMGVDKIPPRRMITEAYLCDVRKGADEPITRKDIEKFEQKHGTPREGSAVIFKTGWSRNTSRKDYFTRNPGLTASAARYLSKMKPNLVGIDSPSIDLGSDPKFPAHHLLLSKDILIVENLCNVGKIQTSPFRLIVMPLKLKGATGSPVRAIAL